MHALSLLGLNMGLFLFRFRFFFLQLYVRTKEFFLACHKCFLTAFHAIQFIMNGQGFFIEAAQIGTFLFHDSE